MVETTPVISQKSDSLFNSAQALEMKKIHKTDLSFDSSWHNDYKDTSWIYIGNFSYKLSEGDVLAVFSQYGEVEDINLIRDEETGKSKGFGFLKYEDWRSTVLAVDNLGGFELLERKLKVEHARYERPKLKKNEEEKLTLLDKAKMQQPGYANNKKHKLETSHNISKGHDLFDTS